MAVLDGTDPDLQSFYDEARICYLCGNPLTSAIKVYWGGSGMDSPESNGDIAFHPDCAAKFALRIASDALKAEHAERNRITSALRDIQET